MKPKKSYGQEFRQWCLDSTMDGLPNIAKTLHHKAHFIFWIVLFVTTVALGFYLVANEIITYLQYDVTTTDRIVPYSNVTFPVVTICNENMFLSPRANDFIRSYFLERFDANVSSYQDIINVTGGRQKAESEMNWLIYQLNAGVWNETVMRSLGYTPQELMVDFSFAFGNETNFATDLEWYFDVKYGNCYRFNSNRTMISSRLGYGLYIKMFIGLPYTMHKYIYEPKSRGMIVEIKDSNRTKNVNQAIRAQPGKYNKIMISKKKSSTLAKPYSECNSQTELFSSPVFDEMKRLGFDYDQTQCLNAFFQYKIVKTYGCYSVMYAPWFVDSSSSLEPCMNKSIVSEIAQYMRVDANELSRMCPVDCDRERYDFSMGSQGFPSRSWYKGALSNSKDIIISLYGKANVSYETVKSSLAYVSIGFSRVAVEEISENPSVLLAGLMSNIGGALNLTFGPSVLTFTEVFELVFVFAVIGWTRKRLAKVEPGERETNSVGEEEQSEETRYGASESNSNNNIKISEHVQKF